MRNLKKSNIRNFQTVVIYNQQSKGKKIFVFTAVQDK